VSSGLTVTQNVKLKELSEQRLQKTSIAKLCRCRIIIVVITTITKSK